MTITAKYQDCDITLLELTALMSKGRIHLEISLEAFLREVEARFIVLPNTGRACVLALGLPAAYPKDPVDRIIAATALTEGLPRIADYRLRATPEELCDALGACRELHPVYRQLLQRAREKWQRTEAQIAQFRQEMATLLAAHQERCFPKIAPNY